VIACGMPGHLGELLLAIPLLGAALLGLKVGLHRLFCRRRCSDHKHKEHPHP